MLPNGMRIGNNTKEIADMPSTSGKQHRFMAAVANNPKFAKKAGVPQSVGEEFLKADKGRKFAGGGDMESKKMIGKELAFMKKKGAPKAMIKHEMKEAGMKKMSSGGLSAGHKQADGIAQRGKTRGMEVKMASGGLAAGHKQADGIAKKGKTKAKQVKMAYGGAC
jgi:hypothetical protein